MKSSNSDHPDRANIRWSETWKTHPEAFIPSLTAPRCRTTHKCVDRHTLLYTVSIDTLEYRSTQCTCHVSIDTSHVSIDAWYGSGVPEVRHVSIDTCSVSIDTSFQRNNSSSRFRTDPLGSNPNARRQVVYTLCMYPTSTFGLRVINKTRVFNKIRISRLESLPNEVLSDSRVIHAKP